MAEQAYCLSYFWIHGWTPFLGDRVYRTESQIPSIRGGFLPGYP